MSEATNALDKERPFKPSFIDRFQDWIETLPIPPWIFYLALGIVLVLVQILFLLVDGGLDIELLLPIIIFNGLTIPFGLGLIH
ncbi:MAG: hypothetical protein ACXADB_11850, partial [Candidatus Hermodarchaeia archaeon]